MNLISLLELGVKCGDTVIPKQIVDIIHLVYNAIRIGVPLILIIVGMFDMGKAITQQKEDEIKKAQQLLVKKAIAAALVFLMFSLVSLVIGIVAPKNSDTEEGRTNTSNWKCIQALIEGNSTEQGTGQE